MGQSESIAGMHMGVVYAILRAIVNSHPNKMELLFELGQVRDSFRESHIALPVPDIHAQLDDDFLSEMITKLRQDLGIESNS